LRDLFNASAVGLAEERFLSGEGLPAAVAIGEDVGEADAGDDFAVRIENLVQAANEAGVAVDMSTHFGEAIGVGLALRDAGERLGAGVDRAVDVGVLEFFGEDAGDGTCVFVGEGVGPVVLEFDEGGFVLGLMIRAVSGESR